MAVEQGQKPMAIVITAGQRGDSPQFEPVLKKVRVARLGVGRPRTRPDRVRADKAYASRKNRAYLRRRGIRCTIPDKADQARNRKKLGSRSGRPPKFDAEDYKARHAVEMSKPQCCHSCGSASLSRVPSSFGIIAVCWWSSQAWRGRWPRDCRWSRRSRSTSAGLAWTTQDRRASCCWWAVTQPRV
ncbi:transposase, partial [Streptomyces sp. NTH33]|uniref:transposase n=1 Tax=Streptomyces sp. NTH33 TaxID=1735453 RepID=UPI0021ABED5C